MKTLYSSDPPNPRDQFVTKTKEPGVGIAMSWRPEHPPIATRELRYQIGRPTFPSRCDEQPFVTEVLWQRFPEFGR